jgi:hypothetical protein
MIILDTDVLSETMRAAVNPRFSAWFDDQSRTSVWTTAISLLEIRFGVERLPIGRRRTALELALERTVVLDLDARILPFDSAAASETAILMAERQRRGRAGDLRDSMIGRHRDHASCDAGDPQHPPLRRFTSAGDRPLAGLTISAR